MNSPRQIHLMSGLIVLFTFLAGTATGVGVHALLRPMRPPPPSLHELDLTPEQEIAAHAIFDDNRKVLDEKLRAILDEKQAKRFDDMRAHQPPHHPPHPFP